MLNVADGRQKLQMRILAKVFCVKCRDSVAITDFTGEEENGDVILKGACAKCGQEIVRWWKLRNGRTRSTSGRVEQKARRRTDFVSG